MLSNLSVSPKNVRWCAIVNRMQGLSKKAENKPKTGALSTRPDAKKVSCDYIGPVDPASNLRQHVRHVSLAETSTQRRLREMRDAVDDSNRRFWESHNETFYKQRQSFINQQKSTNGNDEVTADKMSEFYKKFLDENHKRHVTYNRVWYKQNFQILMLALRVEIENLLRRVTTKN